eukprot:6189849-Pleurochrysis_carterae.AAC.2
MVTGGSYVGIRYLYASGRIQNDFKWHAGLISSEAAVILKRIGCTQVTTMLTLLHAGAWWSLVGLKVLTVVPVKSFLVPARAGSCTQSMADTASPSTLQLLVHLSRLAAIFRAGTDSGHSKVA